MSMSNTGLLLPVSQQDAIEVSITKSTLHIAQQTILDFQSQKSTLPSIKLSKMIFNLMLQDDIMEEQVMELLMMYQYWIEVYGIVVVKGLWECQSNRKPFWNLILDLIPSLHQVNDKTRMLLDFFIFLLQKDLSQVALKYIDLNDTFYKSVCGDHLYNNTQMKILDRLVESKQLYYLSQFIQIFGMLSTFESPHLSPLHYSETIYQSIKMLDYYHRIELLNFIGVGKIRLALVDNILIRQCRFITGQSLSHRIPSIKKFCKLHIFGVIIPLISNMNDSNDDQTDIGSFRFHLSLLSFYVIDLVPLPTDFVLEEGVQQKINDLSDRWGRLDQERKDLTCWMCLENIKRILINRD
ncbi:hypothetical protein BC833DRAFT_590577 [Globomyces pollinis-pini]|nr:hypothetical protein BC833DRAFT_590577 [Globomyces pollinis-pini]